MYRNVAAEMSPDRNGQTEMSRDRKGQILSAWPNRPDRKVAHRIAEWQNSYCRVTVTIVDVIFSTLCKNH